MFNIYCFILTTFLVGFVSSQGKGFNMSCSAVQDDPNQCVRAQRTQKCYIINNKTKCDITAISCIANCCAGWTTDINAKCSIPIKNYVCKEPHLQSRSWDKGDYCEFVTDCQGDEVCCSNRCTGPVYTNHCWYDNIYQTVGETNTTSNDVCMPCTCTTDTRVSQMTCDKTMCDWDNQTDIPGNYTPPKINGLPKNGEKIKVFIHRDRNYAYLYPPIYATDFRDVLIPMNLSKTTFNHCLCQNSTDHVTGRTSPDIFGNFKEVSFDVEIVDRYDPIFKHCPSNIRLQTDSLVLWEDPTVTDNVGVRLLEKPTLPRGINNTLIPGRYEMTYKAYDWSKNTAKCVFTVTILKQPEPPQTVHARSHIGVVVGCTIIAVAVLVLVVFLAIARSVCKSYPPSMEKRKEKHPINNHYGTLAEGQIVVQTTKY